MLYLVNLLARIPKVQNKDVWMAVETVQVLTGQTQVAYNHSNNCYFTNNLEQDKEAGDK